MLDSGDPEACCHPQCIDRHCQGQPCGCMHPCLRGCAQMCDCCTRCVVRYVASKICEMALVLLIIGLVVWYLIAVIEARIDETQRRVVSAFSQ